MASIKATEAGNAALASEPSQTQAQAVFNYYSLHTPPEVDDVSILNGTSPNITSCDVPVADLRSLPTPLSSYNHSSHGFQILHQPLPINPTHEAVYDSALMRTEYYPSIIALLKKALGARSAVVINSTLRDTATPDLTTFDPKHPRPTPGTRGALGPFYVAHSDYTPAGSRGQLRAITRRWFKETGTGDGSTSAEERALIFQLRDEIIEAEDRAVRAAGLDPGDDDGDGRGGHWDWDGQGYEGPRYALFSV
ncbi:hypothetical protein GGR54DRAFT_654132 [Hypoxylon sp. NC1633]|nr:hypothetical protein GGR54DRAFT_654132 [Hypoxylon sp. NC1633]